MRTRVINQNRIKETFLDLVRIPSKSGNERRIADYLINYMNANGIEVMEDDAGNAIGGNSGNVIAFIKGNGKKRILLSAHMDTVGPCEEIIPIWEGDLVKTDGKSILGGDDKSGIVAILELIQLLNDDVVDHPDLLLVFSIAEETGLHGAKGFDVEKFAPIDHAFILDSSGSTGHVITAAPYSASGEIIVIGKEAHAGVAPEKGINALVVAAHAIAKLKVGRVDEETTCNFGKIEGGLASNIVIPQVKMTFEARSLDKEKLEKVLADTNLAFTNACEQFQAAYQSSVKLESTGYKINQDCDMLNALERSCENIGIPFNAVHSMGGSDANVYNAKGIESVVLATGMSNVHTVEEYIHLSDIEKLSELLVDLMKEI